MNKKRLNNNSKSNNNTNINASKNINEELSFVVGLNNDSYIQIKKDNKITYGGNQGWWKDNTKRFENYGCGVISMIDTELYLANKVNITKEKYIELASLRFKKNYHYLIARGVPFWKMSLGLMRVMRKHSIKAFAWWAPSLFKKKLKSLITNMLEIDHPIPASYFVFLKKNGLPIYRYNIEKKQLVYSQSITSHYFNITGIYQGKITNHQYLKISSWGEEFFIDFDLWLKKTSIFSNILYYSI